jgi:hypothetical protein
VGVVIKNHFVVGSIVSLVQHMCHQVTHSTQSRIVLYTLMWPTVGTRVCLYRIYVRATLVMTWGRLRDLLSIFLSIP